MIAVAYDLEVSKNGTSHLKSEPTVKKTTEFYHPKENRDMNLKADSKVPGFFMNGNDNDEEEIAQVYEEDEVESHYDQFNYWKEPIAEVENLDDLVDEESDFSHQLDQLNTFLLSRPFLSGFDPSAADFRILSFIGDTDLTEQRHLNIIRWRSNVLSYDEINCEDVDVDKVMNFVNNNQDFIIEEVVYRDVDVDEDSNQDYGYDSDKENDEDIEEEEDDNDDDGWITPGNFKSKKAALFGGDLSGQERVTVALMTTDFAMQNVCKQMGLNIIGTNGMVIKETKTWILRCYACFRTTPIMEKKFCPKCGNKTLKRVSVTLNADGSQQIHISTRRRINTKGKKYSLPAPKGGKHAWNPRITEDMPEPQQRLSNKARQRNNPMGEDYLASNSPFVTRDTTSKSAMLGLAGSNKGNAMPAGFYWNQRNPNAVRKNTGNKRK